MDPKIFLTIFITVFIAEIGDKTQLATFLYAADGQTSKLTVFAAASMALVVASAIGVGLGALASQYLNPRLLSWAAGLGFIGVGIWTILKG